MSLLQQLVKEVEVYDAEGIECQLADVKVEDNCITANVETRVDLDNFEFEDQTIESIVTVARFKIWINIYDCDVTLDERVEIKEVESKLTGLTIEDLSDNLNLDQLSERVFEFLSDYENVADIYAYVTFASLVQKEETYEFRKYERKIC